MSEAVRDILDRIEKLPAEDLLLLEDYLAQHAEAEWRREAEHARRMAAQRGVNQQTIDDVVAKIRYSS